MAAEGAAGGAGGDDGGSLAWAGAGVVQSGDRVMVIGSDDRRAFVDVQPRGTVKMGQFSFGAKPLIGQPYGTVFELRKRVLVPVDEPLHMDASLGLLATAGDIETTVDNRDLKDDNTAQALTAEDINEMKGEKSGEEIIAALVESSATFAAKTEFSKAKYLKRKTKKYIKRFRVVKPTTALIAETMFLKNPMKIGYLRPDSLGMLLNNANVQAGSTVLVMETCGGLVTGAVADRMGGHGRLITLFEKSPGFNAVGHWGLTAKEESVIGDLAMWEVEAMAAKIASGAEGGEWTGEVDGVAADAAAGPDPLELTRLKRPAKRTDWTEEQWAKFLARKDAKKALTRSWLRRGVDSLIIAADFDLKPLVTALVPWMLPGRPFVVFSQHIEPLKECYEELYTSRRAVRLFISEIWTTKHQVLPGRTHPDMNMDASSGFLLCGTSAILPELERLRPDLWAAQAAENGAKQGGDAAQGATSEPKAGGEPPAKRARAEPTA